MSSLSIVFLLGQLDLALTGSIWRCFQALLRSFVIFSFLTFIWWARHCSLEGADTNEALMVDLKMFPQSRRQLLLFSIKIKCLAASKILDHVLVTVA